MDLLLQKLENRTEVCPAEIVGCFMNIVEATTPYLLASFVERYASRLIDAVTHYMLKSPADAIKTFSSEIIKSIYNGVCILAKRIHSSSAAAEVYERFYLDIAVTCINIDFLERKLNGVTILGDIHKSIKNKEFLHVTKRDIIDIIERGTRR